MANSPMSKVMNHLRRVVLAGGEVELTDGQLLECFVSQRDEAAVAALVRRHGPMVWGVCRRVLHNHHDAEDAFQATFLVLVRKAASIRPREMIANWLYGVAHQTALKARATSAKRQAREKQMNEMPEPAATVEPNLWPDLERLLDQELCRLPDKYRVAIVLCDFEGKTRKEAARQLKIPEGTLSSRLTTARRMLAKRLARHGLTVAGGAVAALLSQNVASAGVAASVVSSTIQAVTHVAAGNTAAAGAISVKAAALTEGVLKTMLLNKLKTMMAVLVLMGIGLFGAGLFGICTMAGQQNESRKGDAVALQQDKQGKDRKDDKDKLQGTWRLITTEFDGVSFGEGRPEIKDSRIVFAKSAFTLSGKLFHSPQIQKEPEDVNYVGTFTLDTRKTPKVIVLTWKTNPWDKKNFTQQGIYTLEGDNLKLCLSLEEDAKKIPTEFSANVGSKRHVLIFKRELLAVPPKTTNSTTAKEQEDLRGTWKLTAIDFEDKHVPEKQVKGRTFVLDKNKYFETTGGVIQPGFTYTLDPTKQPNQMTLMAEDGSTILGGGKQILGIYERKGNKLKISFFLEGAAKKRPANFTLKAGSKQFLWHLERIGKPNPSAEDAPKKQQPPPLVPPKRKITDDKIKEAVTHVQVTGRLVTVGRKGKGEKEWTVTGYVHAEGRDLLLDCNANQKAQKLLKAEFGNPDIFTSTSLPVRNVQVKGRLKFRPNVKLDDKGKRVEQTDTVPVIIVDSLKLVE